MSRAAWPSRKVTPGVVKENIVVVEPTSSIICSEPWSDHSGGSSSGPRRTFLIAISC
jgi:hypothetical protein